MKDLFSAPIPISKHVKKYLNSVHGDYYVINLDDTLGLFLHSIITRNTSFSNAIKSTSKYTCIYEVKFSVSVFNKHGFTFHPKDYFYIGKLLDKYFREKLYEYAIINSLNNDKYFKKSMREFLDFYQITDDDIDLESLYRDFKRQKKQPQIVNSMKNAMERRSKIVTN